MSDKPVFEIEIDIVGTCNLRCPSCPVGNSSHASMASGVMSPELLRAILEKAQGECQVGSVSLFNWAEPFLHPNLPEMVRVVRSLNLPCHLSSNLNVMKNADAVLEADPTSLRISVSGFQQQHYGVTHRGGDIERVKANMRVLAEARRRIACSTTIQVLFHRYLGNHEEERLMREFADSLGFRFHAIWAYLMPLEKNLAYLGHSLPNVRITDEDLELIDRLALEPRAASQAALPFKGRPCRLRERRLAIDHLGNVQLCVTIYDKQLSQIAPFLDVPLDEIQRLRARHPMCGECTSKGLHVVAVYGIEALEQVAMARVAKHDPSVQLSPTCVNPPEPVRPKRIVRLARKLRRILTPWRSVPQGK